MIILLDLNYTLVANSVELSRQTWEYRQANERYRVWLIDLIKTLCPEQAILLTIRPDWQRDWTLANIQRLTGWQPDRAVFSWMNASPPVFKEIALKEKIFPEFGSDPSRYLAIESNLDTHKMYARYGIKGLKAFPATEGVYEPDVPSKRPALF